MSKKPEVREDNKDINHQQVVDILKDILITLKNIVRNTYRGE